MDKKERILQMYFEEHQKQDIIAKTVGVSQSVKVNIKLIKKYKIKLIKKFNVVFPENVTV